MDSHASGSLGSLQSVVLNNLCHNSLAVNFSLQCREGIITNNLWDSILDRLRPSPILTCVGSLHCIYLVANTVQCHVTKASSTFGSNYAQESIVQVLDLKWSSMPNNELKLARLLCEHIIMLYTIRKPIADAVPQYMHIIL